MSTINFVALEYDLTIEQVKAVAALMFLAALAKDSEKITAANIGRLSAIVLEGLCASDDVVAAQLNRVVKYFAENGPPKD